MLWEEGRETFNTQDHRATTPTTATTITTNNLHLTALPLNLKWQSTSRLSLSIDNLIG